LQSILIKIENEGVTIRRGQSDYLIPFTKGLGNDEELEPAGLDDLISHLPPAALQIPNDDNAISLTQELFLANQEVQKFKAANELIQADFERLENQVIILEEANSHLKKTLAKRELSIKVDPTEELSEKLTRIEGIHEALLYQHGSLAEEFAAMLKERKNDVRSTKLQCYNEILQYTYVTNQLEDVRKELQHQISLRETNFNKNPRGTEWTNVATH
jgi:hypothetical protein